MESEIEKLRKKRAQEIKWNEEAALERQEEQALKIVPATLSIIGFFQGCSKYIQYWKALDRADIHVEHPSFLHTFFTFFYFLIGIALGWVIGWLLVKGIFAIIHVSKSNDRNE